MRRLSASASLNLRRSTSPSPASSSSTSRYITPSNLLGSYHANSNNAANTQRRHSTQLRTLSTFLPSKQSPLRNINTTQQQQAASSSSSSQTPSSGSRVSAGSCSQCRRTVLARQWDVLAAGHRTSRTADTNRYRNPPPAGSLLSQSCLSSFYRHPSDSRPRQQVSMFHSTARREGAPLIPLLATVLKV